MRLESGSDLQTMPLAEVLAMRLTRITATDFRCLHHVDVNPGEQINIITGDNASGKTSMLEAIYMLARGQSFRNNSARAQIRTGQDMFVLTGRILGEGSNNNKRIGVARAKTGSAQYRLDGDENTRRYDLVSTLPLQLIDPNLHRLMEQGPRHRRRFLDWGVFHVEHGFFTAWRHYCRALKQRNSALRRGGSIASIRAWHPELVKSASIIDKARVHYVSQLKAALPKSLMDLLQGDAPEITYLSGWSKTMSFQDSLEASIDTDRKMGHTQAGPHRADLRFRVGGVKAETHVSRGQQKILVCALLLAQTKLIYSTQHRRPVLLVDDLMAELGPNYQQAVLAEIKAQSIQAFLTTLNPDSFLLNVPDARMFHVEHGQVVGV